MKNALPKPSTLSVEYKQFPYAVYEQQKLVKNLATLRYYEQACMCLFLVIDEALM